MERERRGAKQKGVEEQRGSGKGETENKREKQTCRHECQGETSTENHGALFRI